MSHMKCIKTPVKGMNDFLPSDMRMREHLLGLIKDTSASYGFMQIETPVMEHIENLTSKQGGDNEKLIFKVLKRGAELERAMAGGRGDLADNGLRYDLTVPLARYYANNKEKLPSPFKSLQIGNVWRADNPQKGRFRQFTQCDIDILGDETNLAEIELIAATADILSRIFIEAGITEFTVHVNDRRILRAAALGAGFREDDVGPVLITLDKLDKLGTDGVGKELTARGYPEETVGRYLSLYGHHGPYVPYGHPRENVSCQEFCENMDQDWLPAGTARNIDEILTGVRAMANPGVSVTFDPALVRGMGYYTGPIFEIGIDGYGFSIAGGGRYDALIGNFCGLDVCASGFSIGFERIITILKDAPGGNVGVGAKSKVFFIDQTVPLEQKLAIFTQAKNLRQEGVMVSIQPLRKNAKAQIEKLESEGFSDFQKVYKRSADR